MKNPLRRIKTWWRKRHPLSRWDKAWRQARRDFRGRRRDLRRAKPLVAIAADWRSKWIAERPGRTATTYIGSSKDVHVDLYLSPDDSLDDEVPKFIAARLREYPQGTFTPRGFYDISNSKTRYYSYGYESEMTFLVYVYWRASKVCELVPTGEFKTGNVWSDKVPVMKIVCGGGAE